MARVPMVTRTIKTTHCVCLCLDIVSAEPCNKEVTLPRTFTDEKKLLNECKKHLDTDTVKVVSISATEIKEAIYGMTEKEFLEHAKVVTRGKTDATDAETPDTATEEVNA